MRKSILLVLISLSFCWFSCQPSRTSTENFPAPAAPSNQTATDLPAGLTRAMYQDKLLGMLVGSAIGDAMGAPVEMWSRSAMQVQYGYIDTLIYVLREGSPEGPWEDNLRPGATTDDTRWKYLLGQFLLSQSRDSLDDKAFGQYIVTQYQQEMKAVQNLETFDPEPLEIQLRHMTWLQEWAKVAQPYTEDDLQGYSYALNRFYGGEMACGGMLYAPTIGGFYPGQAQKAYLEAYRLGIFDLGYARDITGLTAAYVAKAMQPNVNFDSITSITPIVDPMRYANSRLIGRLAHASFVSAKQIVFDAQSITKPDPDLRIPSGYRRSALAYTQMHSAYEQLDQQLQMIPFHAGEIHLINLTALLYGQGDFRLAMEFVTNYGRDNDTVGAITGAILGAYLGYERLPKGLSEPVIKTSREVMGIDLEILAQQLTNQVFPD